jgi:hypothetical protein
MIRILIYIKYLKHFLNKYLSKSYKCFKGEKYWICVSYIIDPLSKKKGSNYFNSHQNRQEAVIIQEIFTRFRLSIIYCQFDHLIKFKRKKFDIVFGLEPNFELISKLNPSAIKIYYATGAYYEHQNMMVKKRIDEFNKSHNTNFPYRRLVEKHESNEIADYIFQIGSKNTILTYPKHLRDKIIIINETSHNYKNIDIERKLKSTSKSEFVWFGGGGNILKGLDLVIDYFFEHSNINLHIIGTIEPEFISFYKIKISSSKNIFIHGFMNVESSKFRDIINICSFLIFPSASEGLPGSVVNLQKLGIIPIVSVWAACDEIHRLGYQLKELDINSIHDAIKWTQTLEDSEIKDLIIKNHKYSLQMHNVERFQREFNDNFKSIISSASNIELS